MKRWDLYVAGEKGWRSSSDMITVDPNSSVSSATPQRSDDYFFQEIAAFDLTYTCSRAKLAVIEFRLWFTQTTFTQHVVRPVIASVLHVPS